MFSVEINHFRREILKHPLALSSTASSYVPCIPSNSLICYELLGFRIFESESGRVGVIKLHRLHRCYQCQSPDLDLQWLIVCGTTNTHP
jgi:hypothetical protein